MYKRQELKKGEHGQIIHVGGEGQLRRHFWDMGLIEGTGIEYMKTAPMGDPIAVSYTHLDVYKRQG